MGNGKAGTMQLKWLGAICVLVSCCGWGILAANRYRFKIFSFQQLICALNYMISELQYRATPLPQLCQITSEQCQGSIKQIFRELHEELTAQISPDARRCMDAVLSRHSNIPPELERIISEIGNSLGKFHLKGQIQALEVARDSAEAQLSELKRDKDARLRSYQTLGLCAGAAIAILLV